MSTRVFPDVLISQIAAGEVVERPAAALKEILENSLDAGATAIQIDLEQGGIKRIRVADNGSGIARDELALALTRPAPSKNARAAGTTIDIQDLFFTPPARRKFLKTEATEYAHCAETVRRLALANPQVAFTLSHNGRVQLRLHAESAAARVRQVMGEAFERNTIAVDAAAGALRVAGWGIRPGAATGSAD